MHTCTHTHIHTFLLLDIVNLFQKLWVQGTERLVEGEDDGVSRHAPSCCADLLHLTHKLFHSGTHCVGQR